MIARKESDRYLYCGDKGQIIGIVDVNGMGRDGWNPFVKPIYNLPMVIACPELPLLVVETEAMVDYIQELEEFKDKFVPITWQGTLDDILKIDIKPLRQRTIYLLPTNTRECNQAMEQLGQTIVDVVSEIHFLDVKKFKAPIGWNIITNDVIDLSSLVKYIEQSDIIPKNPSKLSWKDFLDVSKKKTVKKTLDNLRRIFAHYQFSVRNNVLSKQRQYIIDGKPVRSGLFLARVVDACEKCDLKITQTGIMTYIKGIAEEQSYNPAVDWIESSPWDNQPRLDDFIATIDCENPEMGRFLLRTWMLSVVNMLYNDGTKSSHGAIILLGNQGIGKTAWVQSLMPMEFVKTGLKFNASKDSVIECTSSAIVEFGEVGRTLRAEQVDDLKAFLTRNVDFYRSPYGVDTEDHIRYTSYIATSNNYELLNDPTGNRRWWPIECKSINYQHKFNMQQVWAEVKHYLDSGERPYLDYTEQSALTIYNEQYECVDPLEEQLLTMYDFSEPPQRKLTCTEILEELGYNKTAYNFNSLTRKLSPIIVKLSNRKSKRTNGRSVFLMPSRKL